MMAGLPSLEFRSGAVAYAPDILDACPHCVAWQWRYVKRMTTRVSGVTTIVGTEEIVRCGRCGAEYAPADVRAVAVGRD
jgi:hypothetical protein